VGARAVSAGPIRLPARRRAGSSATKLAALTLGGAAALYLLLPAGLGDDTYAALDWGRELRDGHLPLLEGRAFHPMAVAIGALTSELGAAAPTAMVLLSLASLTLLAAASSRILTLLGFRQPIPSAAAVMVLVSPLLPVLAFAGYNNLPFATLVLWAIVSELEERRHRTWVLLVIAGLVRPEGWAFLVCYGALRWWRTGRSRKPGDWWPNAALSLAPMVIWSALEWLLLGDPLYSFHNTAEAAVPLNPNNTPAALWPHLQQALTWTVLVAAALGIPAVAAAAAPRHRVRTVLAMAAVAPITIAVLVITHSPVPSRHLSVVAALAVTFAAAGATVPARLFARIRRCPPRLLAEVAGAVIVASAAALSSAGTLRFYAHTMRATHDTGKALHAAVTRNLRAVVSTAPPHSIALVGSQAISELIWALHVDYDIVDPQIGPQTQMVIEPSPETWSQLEQLALTDQQLQRLGKRWQRVVNGAWQVYVPAGTSP
jgi:hypothetical protein